MPILNERLEATRNEKRVRHCKPRTGPCGYCGTPTVHDLCPRHQHLAGVYREADDRWMVDQLLTDIYG